MKKILITLFVVLFSATLSAHEWEKVSLSGGAEAIANYSWRGFEQGGLSVQPWLEFSAYGVTLGTWANVGMDGYEKPISFFPEIDVYLSYTCPGDWATLQFTHYYYFGGEKYFNFAYDKELAGTTQDEIELTVRPLMFMENNNGLEVGAAVMIGGGDYFSGNGEIFEKDINTYQKLWSSYVYFKYTTEIEKCTLNAELGFSPHRSLYTYYNPETGKTANFALNNLFFGVNYTLFENKIISVYALASIRFNLFDAGYDTFTYGKNFGWNLGIGFEL